MSWTARGPDVITARDERWKLPAFAGGEWFTQTAWDPKSLVVGDVAGHPEEALSAGHDSCIRIGFFQAHAAVAFLAPFQGLGAPRLFKRLRTVEIFATPPRSESTSTLWET